MISGSVFILIGGKSKRFGSVKWRTKINGISIIDNLLNICKNFQHVHLIGKNIPLDVNEKNFIQDILDIRAPINGLYTALESSNTEWAFLLSSDLPLMVEKVLLELWENRKHGAEIVIPIINGELQPTCALYNRILKNKCYEKIKNNKLSLLDFVNDANYYPLDLTHQSDSFLNMNTKNDLRVAKKILRLKKV